MADVERSWQPVDLNAILTGSYKPPKPAVGSRTDDVGLFYLSKVHTVASESEAGKTWLMMGAAYDEIKAGNHCLYIDFEDIEEGIVGRLLTLGLSANLIREQFHYIRPSESVNTEVNLADLFEIIDTHQPTLAVIDGVTEAMATHGLKINDNDDIAVFGKMLPRKLSRTGCAVVCLDHVVKSVDSRGRYAIGGIHKLNGLDGAAYVLEARDPFGIGLKGRSTLLIAKDRPGQLRKHGGLRRKDGLTEFAELTVDSHTDKHAEISITPSMERASGFEPTIVMGRISKVYENYGTAMSQREVLSIVGGKTDTARHAFSLLRVRGYLSEKSPHKLLKPYRPPEDEEENQ